MLSFVLQYFLELLHPLDVTAGELDLYGSRKFPVHEHLKEINDLYYFYHHFPPSFVICPLSTIQDESENFLLREKLEGLLYVGGRGLSRLHDDDHLINQGRQC